MHPNAQFLRSLEWDRESTPGPPGSLQWNQEQTPALKTFHSVFQLEGKQRWLRGIQLIAEKSYGQASFLLQVQPKPLRSSV